MTSDNFLVDWNFNLKKKSQHKHLDHFKSIVMVSKCSLLFLSPSISCFFLFPPSFLFLFIVFFSILLLCIPHPLFFPFPSVIHYTLFWCIFLFLLLSLFNPFLVPLSFSFLFLFPALFLILCYPHSSIFFFLLYFLSYSLSPFHPLSFLFPYFPFTVHCLQTISFSTSLLYGWLWVMQNHWLHTISHSLIYLPSEPLPAYHPTTQIIEEG